MGELFFKALKWFFFIAFIIGGVASVSAVEAHGIKPLILTILAFGGAYVTSGPWRSLPKIPMITSLFLVGGLAALARYLPDLTYVFLGGAVDERFFMYWLSLTFVIGIPVMMVVFSKYDE